MANEKLRILIVPNSLFFPPYLEDLRELERAGTIPRSWVHDIDANIEYLDQRLQTNPSKWRRRVYKRLPMWMVQVLEIYRTGRRYDVVFLWSVANVTLVLALLLKVTFRRMTIIALFTRISEPKKAGLLKLVHRKIAKIILPPVTQRELAIFGLGVPAEKFVDLPWTTDSEFWRDHGQAPERNMICAAGGEMRDYRTLVEALEGLDIPCHIAGVLDTSRQDWWNATSSERDAEADIPANITLGTMPASELREMYAKSRLVVVPLKPTNSDNGITCMNEAWSMGRPVIVSEVEGHRGAFVDGQEGLWVPPGNVEAMRSAIISLWNDPGKARKMGAAGRRLVERSKDNRIFSDGINEAIADAVGRS
jgi:glycosyltransferase involved in cell wall biosynthesis